MDLPAYLSDQHTFEQRIAEHDAVMECYLMTDLVSCHFNIRLPIEA